MTPNKITVHCSASPDGRHVSVEDIRKWHTDPPPKGRGFRDIGYHFVIYVDGSTNLGRPIDEEGAHVQNHNRGNTGICMVGDSQFSIEQWKALRQLVTYLMKTYDIPLEEVYCHRDWDTAKAQGKTCPNFLRPTLQSWVNWKLDEPPAENIYLPRLP